MSTGTQSSDQPRWFRMGLTQDELALWWRDMGGALTRRREEAGRPDYVPDETDVIFAAEAVAAAWVGYEGDGTPPRPRDFAPDAVPAALRYFYGDWRRNPELYGEEQRGSCGWYGGYRWAVVAALALRCDDATLARLLAWPGEDLFVDEGTWEASPEENLVHIAFARWLRGELPDLSSVRARVARARRADPKLLLAACDAVAAGDPAALGAALALLAAAHRLKRKQRHHRHWVSLDGSLVWLVARRRGLDVRRCGLSRADEDYLVGEL